MAVIWLQEQSGRFESCFPQEIAGQAMILQLFAGNCSKSQAGIGLAIYSGPAGCRISPGAASECAFVIHT